MTQKQECEIFWETETKGESLSEILRNKPGRDYALSASVTGAESPWCWCRRLLSLLPSLQHSLAMSRHTHRLLLPFLFTLYTVRAHEHHDELSEEAATAAVDSILWIHIFLQAAVWGILFPIGMVFGLSRSRWHVPLQVRPARPSSSHFLPPSSLSTES